MALNENYYTNIQSGSVGDFKFKYSADINLATGESTSKTKNTFLDPSIQYAGTILPKAITTGKISSLQPKASKGGNYLLYVANDQYTANYPNPSLNTGTYNNVNYETTNRNFLGTDYGGYSIYPITSFKYRDIRIKYLIYIKKANNDFVEIPLTYFKTHKDDNVYVYEAWIEYFQARDKHGNWNNLPQRIILGKPGIVVFNNGQYTYDLATIFRSGGYGTIPLVGTLETAAGNITWYPSGTRKGIEWLKIFTGIAALQVTGRGGADDNFAQPYNSNGYPSGDPIQNPQGDDPTKPGYMEQMADDYDPIAKSRWDGGKGQKPDPQKDPETTIKGNDDDPQVGEKIKSADENNKLPTINLFNRTFALTVGEVRSLADELWNADDTRFEEIKNGLALMGGNPIQGLIDLRLYPIDFSSWAGSPQKIVVGRTSLDTQARMIDTNVLPQFECTLGTIKGQYGSFMDYEPFSIFQIYLPFVGTTDIPANLVIGHEISCKASVDIITGAISYIVKADGYPILYKNGTIGVSIPMTADNAVEYAGNVIHATNNLVQAGAEATKNVAKDVAKATSVKGAITDPSSNAAGAVSAGADLVAGASAIATAGADLSTTVNQTTIQQSGTASPSNSLYTSMSVYILQEYHNPIIPSGYAHDVGISCRLSGSVGSFSGYTQFSNVDLSGINCTESERTIILETLQNGVYL